MGAILVSFGPFWDTMFKIFIVLGIFAFAGITAQYLEVEIRSWFGKKQDLTVEFSEDAKTITYDDVAPVKSHYTILDDGTVVNNFSGEKVTPESEVQIVDAVSKYPDAYLVQWGEYEDFSRIGANDIVRTYEPQKTAAHLVDQYGPGYLRWRLVGDDAVAPEWVHLSYYTRATMQDLYDIEPPKEKINGQA